MVFTRNALCALTSDQIGNLTTEDLNAIGTAAFATLTTAQIAAVSAGPTIVQRPG